MNWKSFGASDPGGLVGADLVTSYQRGQVNRRDFLVKGTLAGLSIPFLSAVIAACGSDSETGTDTTSGGDTGSTDEAGTDTSEAGGETAGTGVIRVATQKPAGPLDPINMQDLGTYGVIAQSFEFLATLGDDGDIAPGLAESWEPNADGTVWTFNLRTGVTWHDGGEFTSADVAASLDRLAAAGNAGLKGVIAEGSVDASDPAVAVVTLESANGNFPYLVSVYNAQAVITPADYETGTTLDERPTGTGPWKLADFDAATGATFEANADYWGGAPALATAEWSFFDDIGAMVTAASAGEVDTLVQFSVIGGDVLLDKEDFVTNAFQAATHRQIWMRTDEGQFTDKRVRQALALSIDRQALVDTLFKGRADLGNDHVIAPMYPYFDDSIPQRERDIDAAKALLAEAGTPTITADLHFGDLQEIPELAQLIQQQAAEAGFTLNLVSESLDTFYGAQWCPGEPADPPCSGAAELGIVDYGHRATPDVYLNAALATNGIWNSSQYSSAEFDAAFAEYQSAVGLEAQSAAATKLEEILVEDTPIIVPYFYNYISGHSDAFKDIRVSALGQIFLDKASAA
jgi:peptide/nickel transport system substrate-binding protein